MASSGMLRRVALVRTDVSEEFRASFIRMTRIGEIGTTLAIISNRSTLRRNTKEEAQSSFETSTVTRATRRNIPEDGILHSHRRESLKSYTTGSVPVGNECTASRLLLSKASTVTNFYQHCSCMECFPLFVF
jgi:hypothetical protein